MYRVILSNKQNSYNLKSNLRKAVGYRDRVYVQKYSMPQHPAYATLRRDIESYADSIGIAVDELKELVTSYIVDTKGHIDVASLADNEPELRQISVESLKDAIHQVALSVQSDIRKYQDREDIVSIRVYLDVYGYGDFCADYVNSEDAALIIGYRGERKQDPSGSYSLLCLETSPSEYRFEEQRAGNTIVNDKAILRLTEAAEGVNNRYFKQDIAQLVRFLDAPLNH